MDATTLSATGLTPASPVVGAPGPDPRGAAHRSGPLLFARYAFGPNRLGLCGPEDWRSMLELGAAMIVDAAAGREGRASALVIEVDRGLRDLAAGFEGAYPYLELIAGVHGIADPLDARVVEAYWVGNRLSDRVDPTTMQRSLDSRFRAMLKPEVWRWLRDKPADGARPTHAFHVLDVFPRVGLARGLDVTDALPLMDSCRIRWGRVCEVAGDRLGVDVIPLVLEQGRLTLGPPRRESVRRWLDGTGFVDGVVPGDIVSLHWDWACEILDLRRLQRLRRRTLRQMALANGTV